LAKDFQYIQKKLIGDEFSSWFKTFAPLNRAPHIGEIVTLKDHARTLALIAETDGEAF